MRGGVLIHHQPHLQTIMGFWYIMTILINKFDNLWYFRVLLEQVECFLQNVHNCCMNSTTQGSTFSSLTVLFLNACSWRFEYAGCWIDLFLLHARKIGSNHEKCLKMDDNLRINDGRWMIKMDGLDHLASNIRSKQGRD